VLQEIVLTSHLALRVTPAVTLDLTRSRA